MSHWLRLLFFASAGVLTLGPVAGLTAAIAVAQVVGSQVVGSQVVDALEAPEEPPVEDASLPAIDAGFREAELPSRPFAGAGLGAGLTASLGVTRGSYSSAPSMIGDFFGGSFVFEEFEQANPNAVPSPPTVSLAGGDRRFKIAENVSPIPRDRVFFNFNHFENALTDFQGEAVSLGRYTGGFEKTFLDEIASIEMRLPIADGLNSTQRLTGNDTEGVELSNLSLALKAILISGQRWAITGGTTMTLPIADDYVETIFDTESLRVRNQAVHLAPFIGWLIVNERNWFAQGFVQTDFDLNGNEVVRNRNVVLGRLQDQNLLFVDASMGRWLMKDDSSHRWVNGIALMTELHYTTTMNDTDGVGGLTNIFGHMDILNFTAALHLQSGMTSVRVGAAAPLRDDEESLYDAEVIVQLTRQF